jgi:hypothetical protein
MRTAPICIWEPPICRWEPIPYANGSWFFLPGGKNTLSMPMVPATSHLHMGGCVATPICNLLTVFFLFMYSSCAAHLSSQRPVIASLTYRSRHSWYDTPNLTVNDLLLFIITNLGPALIILLYSVRSALIIIIRSSVA